MPKTLSREYIESCTIKQLADEYNLEMKAAFGTDKVKLPAIMTYLGCKSRDTAYRRLENVPHYGGTKLYRTIDIARHFAEKELKTKRK